MRGFISAPIILVILAIGLVVGVVLVQQQQIFSPRANSDKATGNARYQTWNGVKTLSEMRSELIGKAIPGINDSLVTSFDDKSPYQTLKAYQYLPALKVSNNVADQRLFNCTLNVGNLDNMSSTPQNAEVGKEIAVTITQKWEDSFDGYGCATGSIVPKVYIDEAIPQKTFIQDWGSGQIGIFDGTDHKGVPTNQNDADGKQIILPYIFDDKFDGNPSWNADKCFARLDVDPNNINEIDDRGRQLYRLGAGRFVQHGTGGGWYETFVRSCYFTPTKPGNYIVEAHMTHGRNECRQFHPDNNKGDLVAQCRITVLPAGQAGQNPNPAPAAQVTSLSAPTGVKVNCENNNVAKISWNKVEGATGYRIRVDKNPGTSPWFDNQDRNRGDYLNDQYLVDPSLAVPSISVDVLPGTPYKFWTHAFNNNIATGAVSENVTFTCPSS